VLWLGRDAATVGRLAAASLTGDTGLARVTLSELPDALRPLLPTVATLTEEDGVLTWRYRPPAASAPAQP
jgi:hypothetical protein